MPADRKRARLPVGDDQLQPGDGLHRLRHVRPPTSMSLPSNVCSTSSTSKHPRASSSPWGTDPQQPGQAAPSGDPHPGHLPSPSTGLKTATSSQPCSTSWASTSPAGSGAHQLRRDRQLRRGSRLPRTHPPLLRAVGCRHERLLRQGSDAHLPAAGRQRIERVSVVVSSFM